jgi:hypothetical protein
LRGLDGQTTKAVRIASVHFFADFFCLFIATNQSYASPPAVSAYASEHDNPDDPAPSIPDDTNDPDDPDKNTSEVAAVMSSNTAKASAAARAKKKTTAGSKTTGEMAADYTTAPPANKPTKLHYLDSGDKYSICYDLKGTTEYVILTFYLNGMLPPKGGYQCTLAEDGHTIRWSRPVDSFLFSMDHLKGIMGNDYSESNVRVRSFDNILQAIHHNKIEPDTNGLFWGKPYYRDWVYPSMTRVKAAKAFLE